MEIRVYNYKLKPLYAAFLHSVTLSGNRTGIKFNVEQNCYFTKIVNFYIVFELKDWPRNANNNFKFKSCFFGATNIVKNSDKEKSVHSGYGITFNSTDWWSFDSDTARNVIILGVDNSSSSHADNRKSNFLISGKCRSIGINGSFGLPEKKFSINFSKGHTKFCLIWHYNSDNSYLLVNGK